MAGAGAKKRVEENARRLSSLRIALASGLALHALLRLLVHGQLLAGFWATALLVLSGVAGWFCYSQISSFATPVYSPTPPHELLDGGADLNMRGMCGHYHDVLYITVFAQAGSGLYSRVWYVYLVVPGYGLYLLWRTFLQVGLHWQAGHVFCRMWCGLCAYEMIWLSSADFVA